MKKPLALDVRGISADARAAARVIARAMSRPGTYPGFAKEMFWAGLNIALYPAGVISEALELDQNVRYGDGFRMEEALGYLDPEAAATPVILVHGAFHNRSAFTLMRRALKRRGFRTVLTVNYHMIVHDIPELAEQLRGRVANILERTGATRVHLVCHSLGGLVARYYIQELGGADHVHTCITMGTPHRGTHTAAIGRGRASRQLRPNSPLIEQLQASARPMPVRFVAFYSNIDSVVLPAANAKILEPALRAHNVLVRDVGHVSLLVCGQLIRCVADLLSFPDTGTPAGDVTALRARKSRRRGAAARGA